VAKRRDEAEVLEIIFKCRLGHRVEHSGPVTFTTSGGCGGHGPEEYCCCGSPEVSLTFNCPKCPEAQNWNEAKLES
jgi:hypothetical protein